MSNGFTKTSDPILNHNNLNSMTNCDADSTSDTDNMEDTVEFRLLMAYAQRRRPKTDVKSSTRDSPTAPNGDTAANGSSSPQTPAKTEKEEKKKKKKGLKHLRRLLGCIKPQTVDEEPPESIESQPVVHDRCGDFNDDGEQEDELATLASRLTKIAGDIPFTPPEVETDSIEENVQAEKVIALLLRDAGDRLNEEELEKHNIPMELFREYGFFKSIIQGLLRKMGLMNESNRPGPQASPKAQIAVTCEVTSRLSAVDTLPMNRLFGHGAKYLQDNYSSWAKHLGGYEEAFYSDEEDD